MLVKFFEDSGGNKTMKRVGNLYHKICDIENIKLAHKNARKGKTHYTEVKEIDNNLDYYCELLQKTLQNNTFKNSPYEIFTKKDKGKVRTIYKLPYFPDRILHHAILQVLEPIWKKTFIKNTYQSIKGRGIHKAKSDVCKAIKSFKNSDEVYYGQIDIQKFYPSINNDIMIDIVAKKIKCKDTLSLLKEIIYSTEGLPIGNYISQYLGNLYLTYLDHYIKEKIGIKYYFRYCDDIVLLDTCVLNIKLNIKLIKDKIKELNLKVKGNVKISDLSKGLDYLGFVFKRRNVLLRKSIASAFKAAALNFINNPNTKSLNSVISYNGWVIASNSYNLWKKYIDCKFKQFAVNMNLINRTLWR